MSPNIVGDVAGCPSFDFFLYSYLFILLMYMVDSDWQCTAQKNKFQIGNAKLATAPIEEAFWFSVRENPHRIHSTYAGLKYPIV